MPRARHRASSPQEPPATAVEDQEPQIHDEMDVDGTQPLEFDEPLTWRAGKPIPVAQLLRRLQTLAKELKEIDQEAAVRSSLIPKAQELASPLLLAHKDNGVKAYTLVCIVEMFRLLAPDAPYKGRELREIFSLFISTVVPALASPSDPYNAQHIHSLSSLGTIKSICLLDGIPGCETLIHTLFTNCFDVLSGNVRGAETEQVGKTVEFHMTAMLNTLVDECDLPSNAVEVILAQFLRVDPSGFSNSSKEGDAKSADIVREISPAYNLAQSICNTCYEKMVRHVGAYFGSVMIDASENISTTKPVKGKGKKRTHNESEDEDDGDLAAPSEEDLREVDKAHRLLRELWRCSPDVIRNVVPQIEAEVSAEALPLRILAVETIGDMVAGIGAAGPPASVVLDPAAYPSQSVTDRVPSPDHENALLKPNAPLAFSSVYPAVYQGFMDRHRDKAAAVRCSWVSAAGNILVTSGGGKGLDAEQQSMLLRHLSDMLLDQDEKARLAAVQTIERFDYHSLVQKIGSSGGVLEPGSVLSNLADRIKDPKPAVRAAALKLLGRIWGVASGALMESNDRLAHLVGGIPTKIFEACYINDHSLNALVQRTLHESLLPIGFPSIKSKSLTSAETQRIPDSQATAIVSPDPDRLRVERLLILTNSLEEKARRVFYALMQQQAMKAKYLEHALQCTEKMNNGSEKAGAKEDKKQIDVLVNALAKSFPDPAAAAEHFTRFLKQADRRNFALVRFCFSPESDYKKVVNALRELTKRLGQGPPNTSATLDTIVPFMQQASMLVYNKSHLPAILDIAQTGHGGLGAAAHEILKEVSTKAPDVFKVNIKELCDALKSQAPSSSKSLDWRVVESLKACAGFARQFPQGMANDRDFYKAMTKFAMHAMPATAAKQAVTVIAASADKKEMYFKDIIKYCLSNFDYGAESFLSRLATLSQLRLLANRATEAHSDAITTIAVEKILSRARSVASEDDPGWVEEINEDLEAKLWALKIVVNGLRGHDVSEESEEPSAQLKTAAEPVFRLLNTLIDQEGELSRASTSPKTHTAHLRLAAAKHLLKLCRIKMFDKLFLQRDFHRLAMIAQDPFFEVRAGFNAALKKNLGQFKLPNRFYSLVFVYAYDPSKTMKEGTMTWLKSRAHHFALQKQPVMESIFARFLSLLAHHQDFGTSTQDLEEFVNYIIFYLKTVATESNLPQIYGIAQRLKTVEDGIDPDKSENLYALSDLAESLIRAYGDIHGWSLQISATKAKLPAGLFAPIHDHEVAQEISEKRYVPAELAERLEDLLKDSMRTRKRKSDVKSDRASKKVKASSDPGSRPLAAARKAPKAPRPAKTPKQKSKAGKENGLPSSTDRRKSSRHSNAVSYVEDDDSADDEELQRWQATATTSDDEAAGDGARTESSTPPTSDPTPAPVPPSKPKAKASVSRKPSGNTRAATRKQQRDLMDLSSDSE